LENFSGAFFPIHNQHRQPLISHKSLSVNYSKNYRSENPPSFLLSDHLANSDTKGKSLTRSFLEHSPSTVRDLLVHATLFRGVDFALAKLLLGGVEACKRSEGGNGLDSRAQKGGGDS